MIEGTIDVVIPVRNGEATIEAAIRSAALQTRPPQRIVVVDDGSTDQTVNVVGALRIPFLELLSTPPRGASHARNAGFLRTQSEFVALLDADDYWRADKLAQQMQLAEKSSSALAVACSTVLVETDGRTVVGSVRRIVPGSAMPNPTLENSKYYGGWASSVLVRASVWRRLGGFDESITFGEDKDFCMRLAQLGALDACDDVLTYIVCNPNSATRRKVPRDSIMENLIAKFSFYEKWLGLEPSAGPFAAAQATTAILKAIVHHAPFAAKLPECRVRMAKDAPRLAALIARSNTDLVRHLLYFGMKRSHLVPTAAARALYRGLSRVKARAAPPSKDSTIVRQGKTV